MPQPVLNIRKKKNDQKQLAEWKQNGCPAPSPHIVKQITIQEYREKYQYKLLVETGTYLGDMVEAQKNTFSKIISIELGIDLFNKATRRFRKYKHITILHGDSGDVLPKILPEINEPAIFWLDGHYSSGITAKGNKNCPIFEELDAILSDDELNHVLLIDDARLFIGKGDYPTIEELEKYILDKNDQYKLEVKHDIIRCDIKL